MFAEDKPLSAPDNGPYCFQEGWKSIPDGWYCERLATHSGDHAAFIHPDAPIGEMVIWKREDGDSPTPEAEGF